MRPALPAKDLPHTTSKHPGSSTATSVVHSVHHPLVSSSASNIPLYTTASAPLNNNLFFTSHNTNGNGDVAPVSSLTVVQAASTTGRSAARVVEEVYVSNNHSSPRVGDSLTNHVTAPRVNDSIDRGEPSVSASTRTKADTSLAHNDDGRPPVEHAFHSIDAAVHFDSHHHHPAYAALDRSFVHHVIPSSIATTVVSSSTSAAMTTTSSSIPPQPSPRESALSEDITRNLPEDLPNDLPVIDGDISKVIGGHIRDMDQDPVDNDGMMDSNHRRRQHGDDQLQQPQHRQEHDVHRREHHANHDHRSDHDQEHYSHLTHHHHHGEIPSSRKEDEEEAIKSRKRHHQEGDSIQPISPQLHRKQHRPNRQKLKMLGTKNSLSELYSSGGAGHL